RRARAQPYWPGLLPAQLLHQLIHIGEAIHQPQPERLAAQHVAAVEDPVFVSGEATAPPLAHPGLEHIMRLVEQRAGEDFVLGLEWSEHVVAALVLAGGEDAPLNAVPRDELVQPEPAG